MELTVKISDDYKTIEVGGFEGNTLLAFWFGRECQRQGISPYVFDLPHKAPDYTITETSPHCFVQEVINRIKKEVP